jgi:hypothetical protein
LTNHRVFALLLALALGVGAAQGQATNIQQTAKATPNVFLRVLGNGQWWVGLADDAKEIFVDGYTTGMARAYLYTHGECMQDKDKLEPGPQFNAEFKAVTNLCLLAELFDFDADRRGLLSGLDDFYKDPQNTRIPATHALEYTRDKLKGKKSPQELNDDLKEWRRVMSR